MAIKKVISKKTKTTKKTPATKKATKTVKVAKVVKISTVKEAYTKTQIINHISENTGLGKKEVKAVLESIKDLINAHLNKKSVKQMNFLSLFKLMVIKKPATKARKGINPFTGEETMFSAKPAKNVVKVRALKKLKEMADQ